MLLLEQTGIEIAGKHAVVLGRSDMVGSPVCALLRRKDATVTQCHSRTQNVQEIVSPFPHCFVTGVHSGLELPSSGDAKLVQHRGKWLIG